jgi:Holliday junction resolvase-like predicted endonuclease
MSNAAYEKGRRAENEAQRMLERDGYEVARSAGSHGPADLIAWNEREIRFIQIKAIGHEQSAGVAIAAGRRRWNDAIRPTIESVSIETWVRYPRARWCHEVHVIQKGER